MAEMLLTSNLFEGFRAGSRAGEGTRQGCCLVRLGMGLIWPNAGPDSPDKGAGAASWELDKIDDCRMPPESNESGKLSHAVRRSPYKQILKPK